MAVLCWSFFPAGRVRCERCDLCLSGVAGPASFLFSLLAAGGQRGRGGCRPSQSAVAHTWGSAQRSGFSPWKRSFCSSGSDKNGTVSCRGHRHRALIVRGFVERNLAVATLWPSATKGHARRRSPVAACSSGPCRASNSKAEAAAQQFRRLFQPLERPAQTGTARTNGPRSLEHSGQPATGRANCAGDVGRSRQSPFVALGPPEVFQAFQTPWNSRENSERASPVYPGQSVRRTARWSGSSPS